MVKIQKIPHVLNNSVIKNVDNVAAPGFTRMDSIIKRVINQDKEKTGNLFYSLLAW